MSTGFWMKLGYQYFRLQTNKGQQMEARYFSLSYRLQESQSTKTTENKKLQKKMKN
ncbi:unnamed protein product [Larinioides sclopetarius]|uniref:Uncharacterized protein n=1 Tax=Larinioides sclopetarius TaxID=280406 RepID=A0AAV2A9F8_9ARAC